MFSTPVTSMPATPVISAIDSRDARRQREQHREREDRHRDLELVRALLALRVVGDDDEVAVVGGLRQVLPDAVQHQHVAGAQRQLAHVLAQHLLVAVDRQQADAVAACASAARPAVLPMNCDVGGTTASEMPARLGLNRSPKLRRRVLMRSMLFCAKSATCCARAHHADHAADPDPRIGRRRQPRVVAGLQREQQRRAVQRLGFAQRHADQRAVGADREFEHVAFDAVGAGRSSSRCAPA